MPLAEPGWIGCASHFLPSCGGAAWARRPARIASSPRPCSSRRGAVARSSPRSTTRCPWTHPETLTPRGARWHREMAERVADTADVVITPTAAVARELAAHISLPRVEVIGEGVSEGIRAVPPDAAERAARLDLPERFALAVGTLEPRKGLDVAAAALSEDDWPDLPLLIAGPGGWGDALPRGGRRVAYPAARTARRPRSGDRLLAGRGAGHGQPRRGFRASRPGSDVARRARGHQRRAGSGGGRGGRGDRHTAG